MTKLHITIVFLFCLTTLFAQQEVDLLKEFSKQAIQIDSLNKILKKEREIHNKQVTDFQSNLKITEQTVKDLKSDLSKLEKFKLEKKKYEITLKNKNDSINLFKNQTIEIKSQIVADNKKYQDKLLEQYEKGKDEIAVKIKNFYKDADFDKLIESFAKKAIQRDLSIVSNNIEVNSTLTDFSLLFEAEGILDKRYTSEEVRNMLQKLKQIKRKSKELENVTGSIENYQTLNKGLLECLIKINDLDKKEIVTGQPEEVKNMKKIKVTSELSNYIFDYDFNFVQYPYLAKIMLQVFKLKKPNPDADISELLNKLKE